MSDELAMSVCLKKKKNENLSSKRQLPCTSPAIILIYTAVFMVKTGKATKQIGVGPLYSCFWEISCFGFFSLHLSNLILEVFLGSISLTSAILENLDMYFAVFAQQTTLAL